MNGYERLRYWNEPDYTKLDHLIDQVLKIAAYITIAFSLLCIGIIIYTFVSIFIASLEGG